MRRGSLFAPLLLIGLGALFLARNIYPDLRLIDYLAKYWPFLLILWGVLRLGEIVYWNATDQPLPSRGVSGGEWMLVVLLVFFGVALHTAMGFYSWFPPGRLALGGLDMFGESYDYPLAANHPASKTARVVLENFSGSARIVGSDTDEVKVTGHKTVRSLDQTGADRANQDTNFSITGGPDRVAIQSNLNHISGSRTVSEDLEIAVPKGASIEVHGVSMRNRSSDFDLHDIAGTVDITAENAGDVRLENIGGDTRLNLTNSNLVRALNCKGGLDLRGRGSDLDLENMDGSISINGYYSGVVEFHNVTKPLHFQNPQTEFFAAEIPGQVRMPLNDFNASHLVGPVRLKTRFRDIEISDFTNSLELTTERGDVELRPGMLPLGKIDAHANFGNVTLALPPAAKFDLTASTGSGEITNDFGGPLNVEQSKRSATLRGSNGGPMITLRTEHGNVTVRPASPDEPPLAPREGIGRGVTGPKQIFTQKTTKPIPQIPTTDQ